MKLSPDIKRVWRRFSFNAMGWALAFIGWWQSDVMPDWKAAIGTSWALGIVAFLLIFGMVGSCLDQPKTRAPKEPLQ